MSVQTSPRLDSPEKTVIRILRGLPAEQADQLMNFALFLEAQALRKPTGANLLDEEETEGDISASEARWDELFARPESQAMMNKMALEALAEDEAGRALEMRFDKGGNLVGSR